MRKLGYILTILPLMSMAQSSQVLDKVVAVVNDNVITASELNRQVDELRQTLVAKKVDIPSDNVLRKQVLQHLIDVDIELQLAKKNGIAIDDAELNQAIDKIAQNNHITVAQLREAVEKQGLTWESYRDNLKKEVLISRIQQQAVGKEVVVSSQQVEDYLKTSSFTDKEQQIYHLQNIVIPLPEEPTTEQLTKAEAKANAVLEKIRRGGDFSMLAISESSGEYALEGGDLGERHLAELPTVFAEKVVNMSVGQVVGPIRTGNGFQLVKLVSVQENQEHHQVTKSHVRHILIKQDASTTAEEAKKKIDNIYQQINAGKPFGLMAKQYSLDAASAVKEGDLGWVTAETLVPAFAQAMEALPLHKVSRPVKTPFGWHLIEVLERKAVDDTEAYKRQQVWHYLQQRKFSEAVQNWQQHLRADAYVKVMDKGLA